MGATQLYQCTCANEAKAIPAAQIAAVRVCDMDFAARLPQLIVVNSATVPDNLFGMRLERRSLADKARQEMSEFDKDYPW